MNRREKALGHNIGFEKWRVQCFYDSLVQGSSSVFQINICAENRHLRQARKRQAVKIPHFHIKPKTYKPFNFVLS